MTPALLLQRWLAARLPPDAASWLDASIARCGADIADRDLYLMLAMLGRRVPKAPLVPTPDELAAATASRPGWDPRDWTLDQAARVALLCTGSAEPARLGERLDRLCSTGELGELVAYYRGLPLYPDPPRYRLRAAEGVRSNMRVVFEAVAHRNPYPSEQLPESAWNQLVLKALFVGSRLAPIVGLDARRNPTLARMLHDYAHERWAASRPVSPELWRCVGPFATGAVLDDLERLLAKGGPDERTAAALALRESPDPAAAALLHRHAVDAGMPGDRGPQWERLAIGT